MGDDVTPQLLADLIRSKYPRSKLHPIGDEMTAVIDHEFRSPPAEYLAVLRELGWGEIGRSTFMLYEGPVRADEILPGAEGLD